jgi:precorrin-2 dehydrogenase/sirohydrochlorin ferrochelatase/precorrin-6A/cobalt-precorrin-6A reductase
MGKIKKILLFGGTSEGRKILKSGLPLIYSVTTKYGAEAAEAIGAEVHVGRMDAEEMELFILGNDVAGVIDATHPHAAEASKNIRRACERALVPCVRAVRGFVPVETNGREVTSVSSCGEAAELLGTRWRGAKALLTTGSKELACFTKVDDYRKRLFVRVLPTVEVLSSCEKMGFDAGHIIAMQGPFSKAMNRAMLETTNARVLVAKDSGTTGGLREKLEAARECGVEVLLIRRPGETGMSVAEAVEWGRGLLRDTRGFPFFPLFTNVADRHVLVVGGGSVALRRTRSLLTCGAAVTVISPEFHAGFDELSPAGAPGNESRNKLKLIKSRCETHDFQGVFMAVLATNDRELNRRLGEEARRTGAHVSVADAPEECTFYFPALVAEGDTVAAVSTSGHSPDMSRRLAARLSEVWRDWVGEEKIRGRERF